MTVLKPTICLLFLFLFDLVSTAQTISNATIPGRKQIPILCYHQIRDWKAKDKSADKDYIIPPATFRAQMKMLADSGYHTILPNELYDYLQIGRSLPPNPIMLTFDDTNEDQFTVARPELAKYNFKAVYFIITGHIGTHKWYMDSQQIRQLSDEGNAIGCHTLSHLNFKFLKGKAWETEIGQPKKQLEEITGKPVDYFAFPFGYWHQAGLPGLHQQGFKAAFQLEEPRDPKDPLMTIRRVIARGYWSPQTLDYQIKHDFGH
ncbi:polysaccharide deacetylase family protein [Mucilaginibacter sp. X5P1]|uniref:polysaccharide deacetylase family protein n=1 Tax=Mucilaginibacter sp. X5P1 TaxID=2723088 RepID=UPI0016160C8A|nr:polysaccharide deacetylase family protein [Mucilaginibacter sp. X5P1]MBB6137202.1 peptidoglycan/xylan/chitin deacetylase (PgdA/CDA1 family) [Mucilaginibacter sp. X5P1]